MSDANQALRAQLVRILDWEEAHVGFDKALARIPPAGRGKRARGFEHSIWEILEHMRIAQQDILSFCIDESYEHLLKWPDDYWPTKAVPGDAAWKKSLASFRRDREAMKDLARQTKDLLVPVPTGEPNQTYLRAILMLADHNAYHLGQLIAVRRALGIWRKG
jgi:uncharacterized damage-inducible protein DinB